MRSQGVPEAGGAGGAGVMVTAFATHVAGCKVPLVHVAAGALGVNPRAHCIAHCSPLRIVVTPAPHGETPPIPAALVIATTVHGERTLHSRGAKTPLLHVAVAGTALYPMSHATVQSSPSSIELTPMPQGSFPPVPADPRPVPAALVTMPAEQGRFGTHVTGSKVPLVQVAVAALGWNPVAHCIVHSSPLRIVVTPVPHGAIPPTPAALVTAPTVHGERTLHSRGDKTPLLHVAIAGTALNPAFAHVTVQLLPSAIELTPVPHGSAPPVPAALVTVPTEHGRFATHVTGSKVPLVQVAVAALGWYPVAHCTVHSSPLRIEVTPVPHGEAPPAPAALVTATTAHGDCTLHWMDCKVPCAHVAAAG